MGQLAERLETAKRAKMEAAQRRKQEMEEAMR